MSVNKIILIGNVGRTPEIIRSKNGAELAKISLATSETWKDKITREKKSRTEWHNVLVTKPAVVEYIKVAVQKGMTLYLEGSLQYNKHIGSDNIERIYANINVSLNGHMIQVLRKTVRSDLKWEADAPKSDIQKLHAEMTDSVDRQATGHEIDDSLPF